MVRGVDLETALGYHSAASSMAPCGLQHGSLRRGLVRQLGDEAASPSCMKRDGDAVGRDVDPLDQQPQDPRLRGLTELVRHRLERPEGFDDIALLERGVPAPGSPSAPR
jgi:hypothetical protein